MNKILIQIKDNTISFKSKVKIKEDQKDLLNTNIISDGELLFSEEYIKKNQEIIKCFIQELIEKRNISTINIYKNNILLELLQIISEAKNITSLVIKDDMLITHKMCEEIINSKSIKTISVYTLHDFLTEYLDKNGKIIEVRKEILFTSNFTKSNELNKYSSLLYKKIIIIEFPFTDSDIEDFKTFIEINKYLKVIHINKCDKKNLEEIINIIVEYKKKDIKIILHENVVEDPLVDYIKKINSKHKKIDNIIISVSYSDKYLKNNILAQTNLNILKACVFLILLLVSGTFTYYVACNYIDYNNDQEIKKEIEEIILNADADIVIENLEVESGKTVVNDYIASLMTYNKDIVGWITVKNTEIDYPIVQGDDNSEYLTTDISGNYSRSGAIFMNYTNDEDFTDDNTVLFGHNFSGSTIMFSSLNTIKNEEWLQNEDNYIIEIDTAYETLKYEIFSYYTIDITIDYLNTNYLNPLDRYEFYLKLQERSEYAFDIEINPTDKILTLSTCANSGTQRFVVHAVLIEE